MPNFVALGQTVFLDICRGLMWYWDIQILSNKFWSLINRMSRHMVASWDSVNAQLYRWITTIKLSYAVSWPVQSSSVLSMFSLSLLADIQRPTSMMHSLSPVAAVVMCSWQHRRYNWRTDIQTDRQTDKHTGRLGAVYKKFWKQLIKVKLTYLIRGKQSKFIQIHAMPIMHTVHMSKQVCCRCQGLWRTDSDQVKEKWQRCTGSS